MLYITKYILFVQSPLSSTTVGTVGIVLSIVYRLNVWSILCVSWE